MARSSSTTVLARYYRTGPRRGRRQCIKRNKRALPALAAVGGGIIFHFGGGWTLGAGFPCSACVWSLSDCLPELSQARRSQDSHNKLETPLSTVCPLRYRPPPRCRSQPDGQSCGILDTRPDLVFTPSAARRSTASMASSSSSASHPGKRHPGQRSRRPSYHPPSCRSPRDPAPSWPPWPPSAWQPAEGSAAPAAPGYPAWLAPAPSTMLLRRS